MSEGPSWSEVQRTVQGFALQQMARQMRLLAKVGLKAIAIIGRFPDPTQDALTAGLSVTIATPPFITAGERDLLLAVAVARDPEVQALIKKVEAAPGVHGPEAAMRAEDFVDWEPRFTETARRLLEDHRKGEGSDGGEAGDNGRPAPDSGQL
jgi:hypothetical protein